MGYITQVATQAATDVDLTSELLCATYTNTSRIRKLFVSVFLDQIAGNGDYTAHLRVRRGGAGSAYQSVRVTNAVPNAITAACIHFPPLTINSTDVLTVYVLGLAGDDTTPDVTVDINEEWFDTNGTDFVDVRANVKKINDVTIIGDGSATPFHV